MPRAQDFTQSTIYHIRCIATRDVIYVGSTTSFGQRESGHKYRCNKVNCAQYHFPIYAHIRDNGGWDLFEVIPVAHLQLNNKTELRIAEQVEMDKHTDLCNVHYAARSNAQYQADNRDKIAEYKKQYYVDNKVVFAERSRQYSKQYKISNKASYDAYQKQYRADNKGKYKASYDAYQKQYRADNKGKITCECGCIVAKSGIAKHQNTAKHFKLLKQIDLLNYEPIALLPIAHDVYN